MSNNSENEKNLPSTVNPGLSKLGSRAIGATSLKDRLTRIQTMNPQFRKDCLLLDVSGSMDDHVDSNSDKRKIDALRNLASDFPRARKFVFSGECREIVAGQEIPEPHSSTKLAEALLELKRVGINHAVVITDGQPDNAERALEAAKGMRLDVFYVGPMPAPVFMSKLASSTGGEYGSSSLGEAGIAMIGQRVAALLEDKR